MPEYLAPGVFVEEVSFRSKSIEGVGTSVAAIAGPTRFGPIRGAPEVITSYGEFERIFGDPGALSLGGKRYLNHTALAARAFFENGGKQLFVSRVVNGGNDTDENGAGSSAGTAGAASTGNVLRFDARAPGAGGNFDLEVIWDDTQNLLKTKNFTAFADVPDAAVGLLTLQGEIAIDIFATPAGAPHAGFPLNELKMLVTKSGATLVPLAGTTAVVINQDDTTESVALAALGDVIDATALDGLTFNFKQITAGQPVSGALTGNTPAELVFTAPIDIAGLTGHALGNLRVIRGTLNAAGTTFTTSATLNGTVITDALTFNLSALAISPGLVKSISVQRRFSLDVIRRKTSLTHPSGTVGVGESVYRVSGFSLVPGSENYIGTALPQQPEKKLDALTQPIACTTTASGGGAAATLHAALFELFSANAGLLTPAANSFDEPRYIISLAGGTDGGLPIAVDYAGETDEIKGSTGLAALEEIEDISIVMTPAAAADSVNHQAVVAELQKHCVKMRYRVGIVDSREGMSLSEVREFRDNFDDSRLALYYPWVVTSDPTGNALAIAVPPAGFMAGIYARTDVDRGVHKAPANTPVLGALRFNQEINKFQQELLNPNGINCLRSFAGRGHRVWGGRTLSSDPEWKYVNVRRYFLYLERSIDKGTQWAVFEPNGENLWANVVATVDSFLFNEWKNGHLLGSKPEAAYFVRCDRTTMTQNDIDNGRLVCEVGVAPLRPAEFVIFRIGQKTADA